MTYDFHGTWEDVVNVHSPLYSDDGLSMVCIDSVPGSYSPFFGPMVTCVPYMC